MYIFTFDSDLWASLVAQWCRICLPRQETRDLALTGEDATHALNLCWRAWEPLTHAPQLLELGTLNSSCAAREVPAGRGRVPQPEREAPAARGQAPQVESPVRCNWRTAHAATNHTASNEQTNIKNRSLVQVLKDALINDRKFPSTYYFFIINWWCILSKPFHLLSLCFKIPSFNIWIVSIF